MYCCWLLFEFIYIFLFLVETKGKTLEETAALFDGKEVVQNIENVGNEAAHQSRHRYRMFEGEAVELQLSRKDSTRSAALTMGSEENMVGGGFESRATMSKANETSTSSVQKHW